MSNMPDNLIFQALGPIFRNHLTHECKIGPSPGLLGPNVNKWMNECMWMYISSILTTGIHRSKQLE